MGKRLGQHFLTNKVVVGRILDALELKEGDMVVEIGPGMGAVTKEIIERLGLLDFRGHLTAIERDRKLVEDLRYKMRDWKMDNFEIVEGDILNVLPELSRVYKLKAISHKLMGNIPYYITGKLLRIIGELEYKPEVVVLMTQKEVAERVCADPPRMNLLAASVQFWAEAKLLFNVSRDNFHPSPKVDSAVIKLKIKSQELRIKEKTYYPFTRALFKQPRKTILNNLLIYDGGGLTARDELREVLIRRRIDPGARPQNLSVEDIKILAEVVYNVAKDK